MAKPIAMTIDVMMNVTQPPPVNFSSVVMTRIPPHTAKPSRESNRQMSQLPSLIVDELGYLPSEANAAHLFFQLVSRRYERDSMLMTSNRAVSEWGMVFGDTVVATAILDRLLHHSHVITIRGDSYRLREKRRSGLIQQKSVDKELEKLT